MKYRADIDGLRAIAVFAVIIYHANISINGINLLPGGYLGVDIFFVISGFLISKIIYSEVSSSNFSFKRFYERRIRRLIPALFFVCLITIFMGWFILLPDYYISTAKSLLSGILFFSNFYFYFSGLEYDSQAAIYQPLLHLWSLSVEEQFYIFFPLVLLILIKASKNLIPYLIIMIVLSLIYTEYISRVNSSLAFYFILSRAFELLSGALIAKLEINNLKIKSYLINSLLSKLAILMVLLPFFLFNDLTRHPSIITLIPVTGTALLIFCNNSKEIISKLLSLKLIVFFGLISYSMYLWHYPIFVFNRLTNFTSGRISYEVLLGLFIIALSYITYIFIEKPIRNKDFLKTKTIYVMSVLFAFILLLISLVIIFNGGFTKRVPNMLSYHYETSLGLYEETTQDNKMCFGRNDNFCVFSAIEENKYTKKVYILGDSHLANIQEDLKNKLINNNYEVTIMTEGGCIYAPGVNVYNKNNNVLSKNCNIEVNQIKRDILLENKDGIIIYGGRLPLYISESYFNNEEGGIEGGERSKYFTNPDNTLKDRKLRKNFLKNSIKNGISELLENNLNVVLLYPIPESGWHIPRRIWGESSKNNFEEWIQKNPITTSYAVFEKRTRETYELYNSIKHPNIIRVYPENLFCNITETNRCNTHNNDKIFYRDDDHLSYYGGTILNNEIISEINKFTKTN